jgi:hypothetical protein
MSGTETVALVRDLAFITVFVVLLFTALVLFRKAMSVIRSVGRTASSFGEMKSAAGAEGLEMGAGMARSIFQRFTTRDRRD